MNISIILSPARLIKALLLALLLVVASNTAFAYVPLDREEFAKLRNLIRIALKAKEIGYTNEELETILLKDNNKITQVTNIGGMLDFIREKLGYDENQIFQLELDLNMDSIDLEALVADFLKKQSPDAEKGEAISYYTTADIFRDIWARDIERLNETREILEKRR